MKQNTLGYVFTKTRAFGICTYIHSSYTRKILNETFNANQVVYTIV